MSVERVEISASSSGLPSASGCHGNSQREFLVDNLLVRIHFMIVMIRWTGLAPWKFEFPFPGSFTSTFLFNPTPQTQSVSSAPPSCDAEGGCSASFTPRLDGTYQVAVMHQVMSLKYEPASEPHDGREQGSMVG